MPTGTIHLRPHAPVAERVICPGDPGRALRLAQLLLEAPKMVNHNRGLWGYTGEAADGELLTIQSTGMGGPSAAIVVEELIALGARRIVRAGTCGALVSGLALGSLVVAEEALAADGASRALTGGGERVAGDLELTQGLRAASGTAARAGLVVTTDLFYDARAGLTEHWAAAGAIAVEMETAAVFAAAAARGVRAGCVLAVSDLLAEGDRERIGDEALHEAEREVGRVAAAALA